MEFDFGAVDSLDVVPEAFRPLYSKEKATDGKHAIVGDLQPIASAILGLNKSLRAAREDAKKKPLVDLTPLAEFGDSPEKIRDAFQAKIKETETRLSEGGKVNIEKIRNEFSQAHQVELNKRDARNKALQDQLYGLMVDQAATVALASLKGDPELALPFVRNQVKVQEEDGKFNVFVVDQSGDRRYSAATGQPMSIKELVAEMRADKRYGRLFDADAPNGGGMTPGGGKGKPNNPAAPKSSIDKIASGLSKGLKRHGSKTIREAERT